MRHLYVEFRKLPDFWGWVFCNLEILETVGSLMNGYFFRQMAYS